jgi:hypothetical protein
MNKYQNATLFKTSNLGQGKLQRKPHLFNGEKELKLEQ